MLGSIITAFCVQHDANHGAYFRTRRADHLMGWTADALLGFSSYTWRVKHNVAHHTYTNVGGYEDDIDQTPFLRLAPAQAPKPWYRLQWLYVWPLYSLMVLRWQTGGDLAALVRGRIGRSAVRASRRWDVLGLVGGKAVFVGWALVAPLLVYPWWVVLAGYAAFTMAVEPRRGDDVPARAFGRGRGHSDARRGCDRVTPVGDAPSRDNGDFCPRNPVLTWLLGGLNFQIEHHLFPRVQHTHYAHIAAIVQRNCARHGIRYTSQPSLRAALRAHARHLRAMGRLGVPVEIEMG